MRTTTVGAGLSARLSAASCAALTILASASVSACSGSSPSATPTTFSPARSASATQSILPSGTPRVIAPSAERKAGTGYKCPLSQTETLRQCQQGAWSIGDWTTTFPAGLEAGGLG